MIRLASCLLAMAFWSVPAPLLAAQLSAYEALLSVGREKGNTMLANIVEMRGVDGDPQPVQWTLVFADANARGGIREFVVGSKGVISERAPVRPAGSAGPGGTMAASSLKLDSTGAFSTANKQAAESKVGFSAVSYRLNDLHGVPVWNLRLFDANHREVAVLGISAKDGTMVSPLRKTQLAASSPASSARDDDRPVSERWVEGGGLVGHVTRWSERTWSSTTNKAADVGHSVEAFFVGHPEEKGD